MNIRKRLFIFLFTFVLIFIPYGSSLTYSQGNDNSAHGRDTILIICSYDDSSKWESSVLTGIYESCPELRFRVEYLDSKSANDEAYKDTFMKLLDLKYSNSNISAFVTIDDEAFRLFRQYVFDRSSIFYEKPCLFLGVNDDVLLSKSEMKYISGIVEHQNNLLALNLMLESNSSISKIYTLIDDSTYGVTIVSNIEDIKPYAIRNFESYELKQKYIEDIEADIRKIDDKVSAIYLCGTYVSRETDEYANEDDVIRLIKSISKAPIYTKLEPYVEAGAIGGIINDGYRLGKMASPSIIRITDGSSAGVIIPTYGAVNVPMFNFNAIREYNVNPLILPENSVYINKGPLELKLPKSLESLVWGLIYVSILVIILFIYRYEEAKRKAKEQERLLKESIERENMRTDYIVTLSHELRTPLNIILNATKLLKQRIESGDGDEKYYTEKLQFIETSSRRLLRSINNLIDVMRIEVGYMEPILTKENFVELIETVTLYMVDFAKSYNIEIIFDTEEEEIIGEFDKVQIERIILNLISNSIKYTKDGGKITVSVHRNNDTAILEVVDTGEGIAEDKIPYIFDKFKRGDSDYTLSRRYEGSGLGLFIVKSFVELHGGDINVVSTPDVGTVVTVKIPIRDCGNENEEGSKSIVSLEYLAGLENADIMQNK